MNDEPKTLHLAKERISEQAEEIKRLKNLMDGTATPAPAAPTPAAKPAPTPAATDTKPAATMSAWEKEIARASAARLEGLSSKPFEQQTIDELRIALNVETDSNRKTQIFKLIQLRKEENSLSNPRVRLRGA